MATCGNCKLTGQSVQHVKACYSARRTPKTTVLETPVLTQIALELEDAIVDAKFTEMIQAAERAEDERVAAYKADRDARMALVQPTKPKFEKIDTKQVPASKYRIVGLVGVARQYKVEVPVKGKWVGYRFVTLLIGAPADWRKVKITTAEQMSVLRQIVSDSYTDPVSGDTLTGPMAGVVRYSREHKRCAVCESPLSDESQPGYASGVGPVCFKRF